MILAYEILALALAAVAAWFIVRTIIWKRRYRDLETRYAAALADRPPIRRLSQQHRRGLYSIPEEPTA